MGRSALRPVQFGPAEIRRFGLPAQQQRRIGKVHNGPARRDETELGVFGQIGTGCAQRLLQRRAVQAVIPPWFGSHQAHPCRQFGGVPRHFAAAGDDAPEHDGADDERQRGRERHDFRRRAERIGLHLTDRLAAQLSAGGVDVGPVFLAHLALHVQFPEDLHERRDAAGRRAGELRAGHGIVGDQVHVDLQVREQRRQLVGAVRRVVDVFEHDVLDGEAHAGLLLPVSERAEHGAEREAVVHGHDARPEFVVGRVQRQAQVDVQPFVGEAADALGDA